MFFYRGYNKKLGVNSDTSFIWLSDDEEYAIMYGDTLAKFEIDETLINCVPHYVLQEVADTLNIDIIDVLYMPCEQFAEQIRKRNYNAYTIDDSDYHCLCLLDKKIILPAQPNGQPTCRSFPIYEY